MRFTSGHVLEHANNMSDAPELEELVINNLVIEVVFHHGGPRYILRVILVTKLNAGHLEWLILEVFQAVVDAGGYPISLICDNCPNNQGVYDKFVVPGKVHFERLVRHVLLCIWLPSDIQEH